MYIFYKLVVCIYFIYIIALMINSYLIHVTCFVNDLTEVYHTMWCIVHCRYLHYSFTDAVRSQDTLYVVRSVSSNIHGRCITWNFLRNNWATLKDRYRTYTLLKINFKGDLPLACKGIY